jgi:F-type H+-transporting ATPase subunit b
MREAFYMSPTFWVAVAFVLCVALGYKKISALLLAALDSRSAKIRAELDRAHCLREEAEAVLAEYKQKQTDYLREAEAMLAKAREDTAALRKAAERELQQTLQARMQQAVEKIAREEELAIRDVRNHVVDIALASARATIVNHIGKLPQEELIRLALSDIERKIH